MTWTEWSCGSEAKGCDRETSSYADERIVGLVSLSYFQTSDDDPQQPGQTLETAEEGQMGGEGRPTKVSLPMR